MKDNSCLKQQASRLWFLKLNQIILIVLLYTTYFVLFLVSSLILLVAMIGAIVLTMHKTTQVKRQDVFRQNAIDFKNTIRKIKDI